MSGSITREETEQLVKQDGFALINSVHQLTRHVLDSPYAERFRQTTKEQMLHQLADALPLTGEFDVTFVWHPAEKDNLTDTELHAVSANVRRPHTLPQKRFVMAVEEKDDQFARIEDSRLRGGRVGWYPMTRDSAAKQVPYVDVDLAVVEGRLAARLNGPVPHPITVNTFFVSRSPILGYVVASEGATIAASSGPDLDDVLGLHVELLLERGIKLANVVHILNGNGGRRGAN